MEGRPRTDLLVLGLWSGTLVVLIWIGIGVASLSPEPALAPPMPTTVGATDLEARLTRLEHALARIEALLHGSHTTAAASPGVVAAPPSDGSGGTRPSTEERRAIPHLGAAVLRPFIRLPQNPGEIALLLAAVSGQDKVRRQQAVAPLLLMGPREVMLKLGMPDEISGGEGYMDWVYRQVTPEDTVLLAVRFSNGYCVEVEDWW